MAVAILTKPQNQPTIPALDKPTIYPKPCPRCIGGQVFPDSYTDKEEYCLQCGAIYLKK